jgi:hypothetical protein
MTAGTIYLGSSSNTINCAGTINGTIITSGNFRGANSTSTVGICSNTQSASISLCSALSTSGTLTIGSAVGNNNIRGNTTFNNFTPISNVATPTANNHLTRKDYVDTKFVYKTDKMKEIENCIKNNLKQYQFKKNTETF